MSVCSLRQGCVIGPDFCTSKKWFSSFPYATLSLFSAAAQALEEKDGEIVKLVRRFGSTGSAEVRRVASRGLTSSSARELTRTCGRSAIG